ncbi:MAG: hypothetical protein HYU58_11655 [Proteobacteria bacterium]|nr:hypothetical protein [Pseudomonadota bacterium]
MDIARREILAGAAAMAVVAFAGVSGGFLLRSGFDRAGIADLLALLPDKHAAARIGAAWLGRHNELASSWDTLPRLVAERLAKSGWRGGDIDALRALVASLVRTDFETGAIEDVDGWRISRFQAELCGLACLDASRPKARG